MCRPVVWATLFGLVAPSARAEPFWTDGLRSSLTPAVAAVWTPEPPLLGKTREDQLRFVAELGWRLDARHHYSDDPAWRAIMGWPEPLDTLFTWSRAADDRSPARYPHPAGREDPALDFAASVAVAWVDPVTLSCRFPLRARFLLSRGLMRGPLALDEGRCPVTHWAHFERVDGVEVIYVTPSWEDPSASMGHVIFRVRHRQDVEVTGESFAPVFSYSAIDDPERTPNYLLRGLVGGLTATMRIETFDKVYRRYAIDERRDMMIYDLLLSRTEMRDLLAEVKAQRGDDMAVPYRFFSVNCASLAYDLVRSVLPELPEKSSFMTHPHEVVSVLLASDRLRPRGVIRSPRGRAVLAERRQAELARALAAFPGFAALHARRFAPLAERTAAIAEFDKIVGASPTQNVPDALVEYVDNVVDIETNALVVRDGHYDPAATSPALDAALDLRAGLPLRPAPRETPFPSYGIGPSGSRATAIALGVSGSGRFESTLRLALIDEAAGEARAAVLREAARTVVLASETRLSTDGTSAPVVESQRFTVLETANWGVGLETDRGWLSSRLGFKFALGSESWPREDMGYAILLSAGPGLTLAGSDDFAAHFVLGLDLALETWDSVAARFRVGLGAFVELALPLGSAENRWRLVAHARPVWAYDAGFGIGLDVETALDLTLDPRSGLVMRPSFGWRDGFPAGNGGRFALGLAW